MVDRQVSWRSTLPQTQRIELRTLMAAHTECLDKSQHFNLLLFMLAAHAAGRDRLGAALVFPQQHKMIANRRVRYIGGSAAVSRQRLKIGAPLFWHSVRVVQVELIELFHIGSVTTGKVGAVPHALHHAFLHAWSPSIRGHHRRRCQRKLEKSMCSDFKSLGITQIVRVPARMPLLVSFLQNKS